MDEVLGRNCRFLQGPGTECDQVDRIRKALLEKSIALVNITNYMKDGAAFTNRFLRVSRRRPTVAFFLENPISLPSPRVEIRITKKNQL